MPTNDFLTFATDPGANVQTQADYAANANRSEGYPDGYSPAAQEFNKAQRQGNFMAAVLAQYMLLQTGLDVLDDGDLDSKVALLLASTRIRLLNNTVFYVSNGGNDANNGTMASPWLTIQHAVDVITQKYDLNGFYAQIQCADGTYANAIVGSTLVGAPINSPGLYITGNTGSPANCKITSAAGGIFASGAVIISVQGFQIKGTGGQSTGLSASNGATIWHSGNIFDTCAQTHIDCLAGGIINAVGDYSIIGGANGHASAIQGGTIYSQNVTVTLVGTPAFTAGFGTADHCGNYICSGMVFVGTGATGPRYSVTSNGVVDTNGGGANFFPGSIAGVTSTGGQYI